MSFQTPLVLIGLVAVPVIVVLYVLRERRHTSEVATRKLTMGFESFVCRTSGSAPKLPSNVARFNDAAILIPPVGGCGCGYA